MITDQGYIDRRKWMALENANLCSPTVLDRINSLVEPSRSITVIVEESSLVIHPPQILCILLTINPRHGEVSKAMCNKGVEIFMIRPYWALDDNPQLLMNGCRPIWEEVINFAKSKHSSVPGLSRYPLAECSSGSPGG
ncbi:hypothetical protein KIW84_023875 [Lathyrus oleraceus]|uniref:Midasin n=1 Tax=Pisum sativum TaxID=3888 RepID=A0A9D4YGK1_PEA|nr:hypothetical protein KIW84_023875 [Pisum sativum]